MWPRRPLIFPHKMGKSFGNLHLTWSMLTEVGYELLSLNTYKKEGVSPKRLFYVKSSICSLYDKSFVYSNNVYWH